VCLSLHRVMTNMHAANAPQTTLEAILTQATSSTNTTNAAIINAQPQGSQPSLASLKFIFSELMTLNYHTSKEIAITLPGLDYKLTASWGFGGSGNIFSPLKAASVKIEHNTNTAHNNAPQVFNVVDLG